MSQCSINSYPLGHFAEVAEMLPRILLALLNKHGTVLKKCRNVLFACMLLAYTNHLIKNMIRLELVDKAFRIALMYPDDTNVVVCTVRFFRAMNNYVTHRELDEVTMRDVINHCRLVCVISCALGGRTFQATLGILPSHC